MKDRIPFDIIRHNHKIQYFDQEILNLYVKDGLGIEDIARKYQYLSDFNIVDAIKMIAKIIYASGRQPDLSREWDSPKIMGYVGEALTELIVPGESVPPSNKGYDIDTHGNYIEVKSTVVTKVTMSNAQYKMSDFLISHTFHKKDGYVCSYLYPMDFIYYYKPNRKHSVSVDLENDSWAKNYQIDLIGMYKFFYQIERYIVDNVFYQVVCNRCLDQCRYIENQKIIRLVFSCQDCKNLANLSTWYERYCNIYIKRKSSLFHLIKKQNKFIKRRYTWKPNSYHRTIKKKRKLPNRIMANVVWNKI
ncbi:hypothetical protein EIB96_14305 [Vibrio parahaemolyticus]|uniref:hypothetical protein n=2 Tax=Vibrio parahaemolyticus TaxID=670 RepID=UPI00038E449C|nr:hypothetical protein [Vibrio parahaemolyticus]RFD44848.1 hypothetical protein H328_000925 [Vibrio parahaemolyticus 3355]EGR0923794.1 hypothetical protein [Vibrio parahaemolyticus]EGR1949111.1 hypothetical protein [Vibrio parahaemolyticus]EIN9986845.1 hypothetical protein [Vibrio parahaemolyticus]EJU8948269.1 hypothetical protein [Vibrio parahaemolyticus]